MGCGHRLGEGTRVRPPEPSTCCHLRAVLPGLSTVGGKLWRIKCGDRFSWSRFRRRTTLLPLCGVLRVGTCRPCWEVLGVGARSFSSGSGLAFRTSVPLLYTVIAVTSSDRCPNVDRPLRIGRKRCGAAHSELRWPHSTLCACSGSASCGSPRPAGGGLVRHDHQGCGGRSRRQSASWCVRNSPTAIFLGEMRS